MLDGVEVLLEVDFLKERNLLTKVCKQIIYTGAIDEYYEYRFGELDYRGLRFCSEVKKEKSIQNTAVINYTDSDTPYTRTIEHKYFEFGEQDNTVITYEYPIKWNKGMEPYYPVNDERNGKLYARYKKLSGREKKIIFGGRLGSYQYLDMDKSIAGRFEIEYETQLGAITSVLDDLFHKRDKLTERQGEANLSKEQAELVAEVLKHQAECDEFDKTIFTQLIEKIRVRDRENITFVFKNGIEIKADI